MGQDVSIYEEYVTTEWEMFLADDSRTNALLKSVKEIEVRRVLDIGCGAGQEMLPFVAANASGFGVDIDPHAGRVGQAMFARAGHAEKVSFLTAKGGELPFETASFDVVICRVALMYMDNRKAISEIARVLRIGGRFFLKYHAPAYYRIKFINGLKNSDIRSSVHAVRVLAAGYWYQITGNQPFNKLTAGGEIFQTEKSLKREFSKNRLEVIGVMPDTNPQTPSLIIAKV